MSKKISVDLDIGEMFALIEYNRQAWKSIPEECYNTVNMAGTTFRDVAQKYQNRWAELSELLDETWPK